MTIKSVHFFPLKKIKPFFPIHEGCSIFKHVHKTKNIDFFTLILMSLFFHPIYIISTAWCKYLSFQCVELFHLSLGSPDSCWFGLWVNPSGTLVILVVEIRFPTQGSQLRLHARCVFRHVEGWWRAPSNCCHHVPAARQLLLSDAQSW